MTLPAPTPRANLGVRCRFPNCPNMAEHRHHVQYATPFEPEVIEPLCSDHHQQITNLNAIEARRVHHRLSRNHRWFLWYEWLAGRRKPRNTRRCREWWEREREQVSDQIQLSPALAGPEPPAPEETVPPVSRRKRPGPRRKVKRKAKASKAKAHKARDAKRRAR